MYANVNGLKMYYEVHGEGKPLVLLHGGLMTIDMAFGALLPDLAENRQVIAAELQGHGHTADIDRPIELRDLASDVAGLLDHLDVASTDVFGFSLGGGTALQFVLDHPGRVNRAIIGSIAYSPDGFHQEIFDPAQWATSTRMPTADDFAQMHDAYVNVAPDPGHFAAFAAKLQSAAQSPTSWTPEELAAITAPVLLVYGDHDFFRLEHAVELYDLIPGAQLAILPGTTHMGVLRRTALIHPLVEEFLG